MFAQQFNEYSNEYSSVSTKTFAKVKNGVLIITKNRYSTLYTPGHFPYRKITLESSLEETYPLKKVSENDVRMARVCMIPTFLMKKGKLLFMATIPNNLNIASAIRHLCGNCHRCRALPISQGGCSKVSDLSIDTLMSTRKPNEAFDESQRLEKYNFVKLGVEVFGTKNEAYDFISIAECLLMNK